jgi:hypothetical protein
MNDTVGGTPLTGAKIKAPLPSVGKDLHDPGGRRLDIATLSDSVINGPSILRHSMVMRAQLIVCCGGCEGQLDPR